MSKILTETSQKIQKFAKDLVGNRVFDLYLKYMGIHTLTSATLVPVALLVGKDALENFMVQDSQVGGELPVLDDPLIGNYLKLAGISTIDISVNTLVPIGILMLIYELYVNKETQKGGSLNKHVKRVWGNRVVDLFTKYLGIKTLTSATLVPIALILGKQQLENFLKDDQSGGFLPEKIPLLDDPLLGNYLKLAGLATIKLSGDVLVPLGIIAVMYNLYK